MRRGLAGRRGESSRQEWKDVLLRGRNPADLADYTKRFHDAEARVKSEAKALAATVDDPEAKRLLAEFGAAHDSLSGKYEAAYAAYLGGFDFAAADRLVRGQDRTPTDLFDKVVARLEAQVASRVAAQRADVVHRRNVAFAVTAGLLAVAGAVFFAVVRGVLSRLGRLKLISDRLAHADVSGLGIDISGEDEVGEFGESMKGVAAAIEELSTLATAKSA